MVINPFRNRVRFIIERLLLSGTTARLAVAAALIALVALGTGVLGFLVARGTDQPFANPAEAVWWAFLRLSDPGYLGDDEGTGLRAVSTLITVIGPVLFFGVLVAILTQGLNEGIRRMEMGLTPISARNHVIVLGWSTRLPGLVRNMLESEQRLKRFLARVGAKRMKLVLLWEEVSPALTTDFMTQVGVPGKTSRIILRTGSPLRLDHLTRVDYLHASAIVLPAENHRSAEGASRSDNSTLKTILSISQSMRLASVAATPPLLVAELFDARKISVALHGYRGPIEVVAGDEVISRMLAQMVRHAQIGQVYRELLTHGVGNELFAHSCDANLAGQSFWELAARLPHALLIGVAQPDATGVSSVLNPPPDYRLADMDKLIYVARGWEDSTLPVPTATGVNPAWPLPERKLEALAKDDQKILVLGWSRRIPAFLQELESYKNQRFEVTVASRCPLAERERQLRVYGGQLSRVGLRHVEADCTVPDQLAALDPSAQDVVLCLASDLTASDEESDARTLVEYAILGELWGAAAEPSATGAADERVGRRPRLVLELLDELNVSLLDPTRCEYLLSPQVLSHMLGQVALRRELNSVFEQLFNSGETEITLRNVMRYDLEPGRRVSFAELQVLARQHHEIALGYLPSQGESESAPMLNPGPTAAWTIQPGDRVVVLRN